MTSIGETLLPSASSHKVLELPYLCPEQSKTMYSIKHKHNKLVSSPHAMQKQTLLTLTKITLAKQMLEYPATLNLFPKKLWLRGYAVRKATPPLLFHGEYFEVARQ